MARLRLFGPAREAAGTGSAEVPAGTVAEALAWAEATYGPTLGRLLPSCAVWVNGEPAMPGAPVADADEVAILPPVAGG